MKRNSLLLIVTMALAGFACAQEDPSGNQLFSSDLVAWSGMQQPQAPEQPGQQTAPSHAAQPASSQNSSTDPQTPRDTNSADPQSSDSQNQSPAATTFTGTISREADGFVLKISETSSYKLDAQRQVEQYEGQRVRVTGTVETGVNIIHVDRIEPLS